MSSKTTAKPKARKAPVAKKAEPKPATAKDIAQKRGLAIVRATEKGIAIAKRAFGAEGLTQNLGTAIGRVNSNISVTATGLKVKKGYEPTEEEVTEAISGLCGINEETAKFKTTVTWAIGDAALLAEKFEGGIDRVAAQAIRERGVSKHTVMQSAVVCREFAPEDRIAGLSFTHHQELRNYREGIKNKAGYKNLVEELRDTAKKDEAMSCADLREKLQELSGKSESNGDKPSVKEHTFVYISESGEASQSTGLNKAVCKAGNHLVLDVDAMTVIKGDGNDFYSIPALGAPEVPEPVKVEKAPANVIEMEEAKKKPEPKSTPKPKAKASSIPD